jgi:Fanconi anemia group M protein
MERTNSFIPDPMTAEEISSIEASRTKLEAGMEKVVHTQRINIHQSLVDEKLVSHHVPLLVGDQFYTTQFVRNVNNVARKIYALLTKKGRSGEDVDTIRESLGLDNTTLIEALNKLEKLKRIQWLDDATIVLSENLQILPGKVHDIYIEKILSGTTLVMIDGKWHARLNHYDYEGPRHLLKKGTEFRAVSELYRDGKTFCIRIKQIV